MSGLTITAVKRARRRRKLLRDYQALFPDIVQGEGEPDDDYFGRMHGLYLAAVEAKARREDSEAMGITGERYDQGDLARLVQGAWRIDDVSTPCKRLLSALPDITAADRQQMLVAAARFTHDWRVAYEGGGVSGYREKVDCSMGAGDEATAIVAAARARVLEAMNVMNADAAVAVRDMLIYDVTQVRMPGLAQVYGDDRRRRVAAGVIVIIGLRDLVRYYGG